MADWKRHQQLIDERGYTVIDDVFTTHEIELIALEIEKADKSRLTFRQSDDLFAIRQLLKEMPQLEQIIFNDNLRDLLTNLFGHQYFVCKSIYFDKPQKSNWFVAWHQDLTISVKDKAEVDEYGPWTVKHNQFAVQPPLSILEDNFTIRIHLDNTNDKNGALKVLPKSHNKGVVRAENIDWDKTSTDICNVSAGGAMIMKPLLFHASGKTTNDKQRRVIHIEFSRSDLPKELNWAEKLQINYN